MLRPKECAVNDERFERVAATVMQWLEARGYSPSVRLSHRRCYRLIGEHLDSNGLVAGPETLQSWLSGASPMLPESARKAYKTAVSRVIAALELGVVPDNPLTHRGPSLYSRLPEWAAMAVDEYVEGLAHALSESSLAYERVCASHFMSFACDAGVDGPAGLTADVVLAYGEIGCQSESTRARRLSAARGILGRMHAGGKVPLHVAMLADDRFCKWAACCEPIPGLDSCGDGLDAEDLPRLAGEFVDALEGAGYTRTPVKSARKALGLLYIFLSLNGLRYTQDVAASWADRAVAIGGKQGRSWRRATMQFGLWLPDRTLRPMAVFCGRDDPAGGLPGWASAQLEAYLTLRRREGCAKSTLGRALPNFLCVRPLKPPHTSFETKSSGRLPFVQFLILIAFRAAKLAARDATDTT